MIQARTKTLNMFAVANSLVMALAAILMFQQVFLRPIPVIPNTQAEVERPQQPPKGEESKQPTQLTEIKQPTSTIPQVFDPDKIDNINKNTDKDIKYPPLRMFSKPEKMVIVTPPESIIVPPKQLPLAKMVLDNFNGSSEINAKGGIGNDFGGTGGFCLKSYQKGSSAGAGEDGGCILKLVYNVNNGYAGYYSKLNGLDLTKYNRITFNVKGAQGGEVFEVELGDGLDTYKVDIREYLLYGASTTWQKVSIPLKAFTDVKNWNKMTGNFAIVFEQYLGMPTNSTLYVDNITFEE